MIIKIIGLIIIFITCAGIGFVLSSYLSKRVNELRELQSHLLILENEIGFMSRVLSEAFFNSSKSNSNISKLFIKVSEYMRNYETSANEALKRGIEEMKATLCLNAEDIKILKNFGGILGNSDVDGQKKNIKMTIELLKIQEEKAEEDKKSHGKMYKSLGMLTGIALVVILF